MAPNVPEVLNIDRDGHETPKVLVVDSDPHVSAELKRGLDSAGFAVSVADNGEQLIAAVECARFDGVLLDEELPDIRGLGLVFSLRHRCPDMH